MTQKKIEPEDFSKIKTFKDDAFAIVDASVIKALKNIPLADSAIVVPLKTSIDEQPFKIVAKYDDATLRKLIIMPADADESEPHPSDDGGIEENSVGQIRGHGGDAPKRKIDQLTKPKAKRSKRNELYKKNRRPVDPKDKLAGKMGEFGKSPRSDDGGNQRDLSHRNIKRLESIKNTPVESVCLFLKKVKNKQPLNESDFESLGNIDNATYVLRLMHSRCFGVWKEKDGWLVNEDGSYADPNSWDLVDGQLRHKEGKSYDFDLIYEAIRLIKDYVNGQKTVLYNESYQKEVAMFEKLILRRLDLD